MNALAMLILPVLLLLTPPCHALVFRTLSRQTGLPCIMLDTNYHVEVSLYRDGFVNASRDSHTPVATLASLGPCDNQSAVMSLLLLDMGISSTLELIFNRTDERSVMLHTRLTFSPKEVFGLSGNSTEPDVVQVSSRVSLGSSDSSYLCDRPTTWELISTNTTGQSRYRTLLSVFHFQVEAFNLPSGGFSPAVTCDHLDPTPAPPAMPTYIVKNGAVTCIAMEARVRLTLSYLKETGLTTVHFALPDNALASGECHESPTGQILTLSFFDDWQLVFQFTRAESESNPALPALGTTYRLSNVSLQLTFTEKYLPGFDISVPGSREEFHARKSEGFPRVDAGKGYYSCKAPSRFVFGYEFDGNFVELSDLKLRAFGTDSRDTFQDEPEVCSADTSFGGLSTPLIVGIACGAGILLCAVVVGFVVHRSRYRRMD